LEDEEWDAELEVPFAGFVAKELHGEVDAAAAPGSGEKEDEPFGRAVGVAAAQRLSFIVSYDSERNDVYDEQETEESEFYIHSA
jgi:hypothetical protein